MWNESSQKTFISLFLLSLFTLFQISTLLFVHVHEVNGAKIAHSHPNPGQHDHTTSELLLINFLGQLEVSSVWCGEDFISLIPRYCELCIDRPILVIDHCLPGSCLLRAPPFFSIHR
ncbi:MAG: hypothetical protein LIP08_06065 [Bacteroides sp.]|nr:hypothetical protein [Bacteroides sp.]